MKNQFSFHNHEFMAIFCPFFSGILKYYPNNQELFCNLLLYLPENVLHLIKILLSFDIIFFKEANEFTIIIAAQN